jgi:hypothetical protein
MKKNENFTGFTTSLIKNCFSDFKDNDVVGLIDQNENLTNLQSSETPGKNTIKTTVLAKCLGCKIN